MTASHTCNKEKTAPYRVDRNKSADTREKKLGPKGLASEMPPPPLHTAIVAMDKYARWEFLLTLKMDAALFTCS
jgi:hypothetical protein